MKKIRIGIIGAGAIVRDKHLPNLQKIPGVQVVAVCNGRRESAEQVAKDAGIPEVVGEWPEMIDRRDLDAIWIGTHPHLHAPITISALEAGKHVFCQARMAMNLMEAREMLSAAQARSQQVTMLCPPPHGMKCGPFFQKLLREGYVGDMYHFRLQALNGAWSDPDAPAHWRQRVELSGLNMLSVGIYAEVLGRWLGPPRRLHAQMKVAVANRQGYPIHVPDVVQIIGQWPGGVVGNLEWSGMAQFAPAERLEVYGSGGTLVYEFGTERVFGARRGDLALQELPAPAEWQADWTVENDFIQAIREGGQPEPSFETGVRYMEFLEAAHRSARGGHAIELPLS